MIWRICHFNDHRVQSNEAIGNLSYQTAKDGPECLAEEIQLVSLHNQQDFLADYL